LKELGYETAAYGFGPILPGSMGLTIDYAMGELKILEDDCTL